VKRVLTMWCAGCEFLYPKLAPRVCPASDNDSTLLVPSSAKRVKYITLAPKVKAIQTHNRRRALSRKNTARAVSCPTPRARKAEQNWAREDSLDHRSASPYLISATRFLHDAPRRFNPVFATCTQGGKSQSQPALSIRSTVFANKKKRQHERADAKCKSECQLLSPPRISAVHPGVGKTSSSHHPVNKNRDVGIISFI